MPTRSPEEIRASIEHNRQELGESLVKLRGEVVRLTDWRAQLRVHRQQAMIAAGVAGFLLGGGLAVLGGRSGKRAKAEKKESGKRGRRWLSAGAG